MVVSDIESRVAGKYDIVFNMWFMVVLYSSITAGLICHSDLSSSLSVISQNALKW